MPLPTAKAPRSGAVVPAALIAAGLFILFFALQGGVGLGHAQASLKLGGAPQAPALVLKGQGGENESASYRRMRLAEDLDWLKESGAAVIILEAWLDDESQGESALLLDEILEDAGNLGGNSGRKLAARVADMKGRLDADERLAKSIASSANVILPAAVEPADSFSSLTRPSSIWDKGAYQVSRKGKGVQFLEREWKTLRAPLKGFREGAFSVAAVTPLLAQDPGQAFEAPAVFQIRKFWVNGLGLEAYRAQQGLPSKALRFIWKGDHLAALELGERRISVSSRGGLSLATHAYHPLPEVSLPPPSEPGMRPQPGQDRDALAIEGKVVFFQPWPTWLAYAEGFARQHQIFAALSSDSVEPALATLDQRTAWAGIALLCLLAFAMGGPWGGVALLLAAGAWIGWDRHLHATAWFQPLVACLGASLAGMGISVARRLQRAEQIRFRFLGAAAPERAADWSARVGKEGMLELNALYLAAKGLEPALWEGWARRFGAFCEAPRDEVMGFLLPLESKDASPWPALAEFRDLARQLPMTLASGSFQLREGLALDAVRWKIGGEARQRALSLLDAAKSKECLLVEEDYLALRDHVKIQLLQRPEFGTRKVLNVLEIV